MPKKDKDFVKELQETQKQGKFKPSQIKKSRSVEDLKPQSNSEIAEKEAQIAALTEQITRIKKEANQSLQVKEQEIKELAEANEQLTDHNNELRINKLKDSDELAKSQKNEDKYFTKYQTESQLTQQLQLQLAKCQKDLTITQQDLKSAQRVIELRTIEPVNSESKENSFDYWLWIRMGSLALLIYLLSQDKEH